MNDHDDDTAGDARRPPRSESADAADEDLRATAESIRADSHALTELEDEKLALPPDDPQVDVLSARALELAERIALKARAEQQLSEELG
jgi:hypothetical protein